MAKIIQNHGECIGCGACEALCPKFWEMKEENNKAHLKKGKFNKENQTYGLEVSDIECNQEAADACPVGVIKII